jgi:hypothetical protein
MARPYDKQSFDAFTPTGSGHRTDEIFPPQAVPEHVARYEGRPPYMTDALQQAKLQKKGAEYGPL